jgi:hypothetical protein
MILQWTKLGRGATLQCNVDRNGLIRLPISQSLPASFKPSE